MSVYTQIDQLELQQLLARYDLGQLISYAGIEGGTHNTNYAVTTTESCYVLTLFEDFTAKELAPVIKLIEHLAQQGLPFAPIIADQQQVYLQNLHNKPTVIVPYLPGKHLEELTAQQCSELGIIIGKMHLYTMHFPLKRSNFRGSAWRIAIAKKLLAKLDATDAQLLQNELAFMAQQDFSALPQGIIHSDIFRDNVLFHNQQVSGIIDAYNACHDWLLLDVAIAVNDCCLLQSGEVSEELAQTLLKAYQQQRPFSSAEIKAWPSMLRIAALTFWLLRLNAMHFPLAGKTVQVKNPTEYKEILLQHQR